MQQLYLTGSHASDIAVRLFTTLNVRPVGLRLLPFEVGGELRGEALRLLLPPSAPLCNNVPCRIRLSDERWIAVPAVLETIAAPSLQSTVNVHAPLLLDGLTADVLACAAFRDAVRSCLMDRRAVIATVREDARSALQALTPADRQQWMAVPDDPSGQADLLEALLPEVLLRC